MKRVLLGAALICSCVTPAVAEEPPAAGTIVRLPAENVYYGCYDVENAKEVERIRAESNESGSAYGRGARGVDQFVREHGIGLSTHKPRYFSDVCVRLPTDISWSVVGTYNWPDDGGPQLACVAPMETFNVGPQVESSPAPRDEPGCWWTNLHNE